jgi:methionyl-tRNA formyltransferase
MKTTPPLSGPRKVLFLGPDTSLILAHLRQMESDVVATANKIDLEFIRASGAEFAVSHGYRYIVRKPVLDYLKDRVINLHISYLPWNRGTDPNFWSLIEGTPKGVTIHYMDEGVDTGDIIAQRHLECTERDTLQTSYDKLQIALYELFVEQWSLIRVGQCRRCPQSPQSGTFHMRKDKNHLLHLIAERGYDTPVSVLMEYGQRFQGTARNGQTACQTGKAKRAPS